MILRASAIDPIEPGSLQGRGFRLSLEPYWKQDQDLIMDLAGYFGPSVTLQQDGKQMIFETTGPAQRELRELHLHLMQQHSGGNLSPELKALMAKHPSRAKH